MTSAPPGIVGNPVEVTIVPRVMTPPSMDASESSVVAATSGAVAERTVCPICRVSTDTVAELAAHVRVCSKVRFSIVDLHVGDFLSYV